ncbi:hypothetical protein GHR37_08720 [Achromobacter xylosoxidans]|nr:hypothetical protein [Achromobacter xylosoxidans]
MAIDGEPKDGDFVRYIENLTRAGGAARGRVEAERVDAGLLSDPFPTPARKPAAAAPAGQEDPAADSLARRARQRKIGIILTIGGVLAGWAAARIVFQVLRSPQVDLDELMPAAFLVFFAVMLFKAAAGARNPRRPPLAKLPPLKTSAYRKDGSA